MSAGAQPDSAFAAAGGPELTERGDAHGNQGRSAASPVVRVALDVPVPTLFDYLLPLLAEQRVQSLVGRRVRVPFGRGSRIGVIVEVAAQSPLPADRLKAVLEIFADEPALDGDILELLQFATRYRVERKARDERHTGQ